MSKFQTGGEIRSDGRIVASTTQAYRRHFPKRTTFPFTANFDVIHGFSCHFLRDGGRESGNEGMSEFYTARGLAALYPVEERKVYDLVGQERDRSAG